MWIFNDNGGLISGEGDSGEKEIPEAIRRAMEKAKEYQKNKEVVSNGRSNVESENLPGSLDFGLYKSLFKITTSDYM